MHQRLQSSVLVYTRTIGATKVLELRGGMGRVAANRVPWSASLTGNGGFDPTQLGFPPAIAAQANQSMFPTVTIQDMTQLGPNGGNVYHMWDMSYTGNGSLSWVVGRHNLKFGGDVRSNLVNYGRATNPVGIYQFYRSMTQGPNPFAAQATSGIGYASFLPGTGGGINNTAGFTTDEANPANANRYFAFYAQDHFRASSKLTFNVGLRWDIETGSTKRYDRQTVLDPFVRNPLSDATGLNLKGGTLFSGSTLGRRAIVDPPLKHFGPRVSPRLSARAATIWVKASRRRLHGLTSLDGATPISTLSNPFPGGFNRYQGTAAGLSTQVGATLNGPWPAIFKTPYNQRRNLTIQKQFGAGIITGFAYAGNKATHLPYFQPSAPEFNQLNPELLSLGSSLLSLVRNPFFGIITTPGILSQPTVQQGQLLRSYPHYTGFQIKSAPWGNSNYHARQTRIEKRFSKGATLMAAYTFSKTISGAVDYSGPTTTASRSTWARRNPSASGSTPPPLVRPPLSPSEIWAGL